MLGNFAMLSQLEYSWFPGDCREWRYHRQFYSRVGNAGVRRLCVHSARDSAVQDGAIRLGQQLSETSPLLQFYTLLEDEVLPHNIQGFQVIVWEVVTRLSIFWQSGDMRTIKCQHQLINVKTLLLVWQLICLFFVLLQHSIVKSNKKKCSFKIITASKCLLHD